MNSFLPAANTRDTYHLPRISAAFWLLKTQCLEAAKHFVSGLKDQCLALASQQSCCTELYAMLSAAQHWLHHTQCVLPGVTGQRHRMKHLLYLSSQTYVVVDRLILTLLWSPRPECQRPHCSGLFVYLWRKKKILPNAHVSCCLFTFYPFFFFMYRSRLNKLVFLSAFYHSK